MPLICTDTTLHGAAPTTTALDPGQARWWLAASASAAGLAAAASAMGLLDVAGTYGRETASFVDQAVAQDVVNLVLVAPATLALAWLARRGSARAALLWLGVLSFTVYNYVIYTMAIHVGPLWLAWGAVLGASLWSLVGGLRALDPAAVVAALRPPPRRTVGVFLVVVAALFTLLWLSDIVPAVLAGRLPDGAVELGLPANPVHVLDLAFYLPAVLAIGVLVLRRRPHGIALSPIALVFLLLTGLPIIVTPMTTTLRGGEAVWAAAGPVGVLTLATAAVLAVALRRPRPGTPAGPTSQGA